jgi:hypothetical protein
MYNIIFFNTEICGVFNRNNSIVKVSQNIFKILKSVWWSMILVQHDIFGNQSGTTFFWFLVIGIGAGNVVPRDFCEYQAIQEGRHPPPHT